MTVVEGVANVEGVDEFLNQLAAIGAEYECAVQAFDARYVAGREQLQRAVELADRAIERGENVARDRAVEILLYAAGRRQIDDALEMGVGRGEQPVVIVVDGHREAEAAADVQKLVDEQPTLGEAVDEQQVMGFFEITDSERAATTATLESLVCERVALLDVEK